MSFDTVVKTTGLLGIAGGLFALTFIISEIDHLSRRPKPIPVRACNYSRRTTIMAGQVLSRNTVRINGRTWDLPQPLDSAIRPGQRISLVLEG